MAKKSRKTPWDKSNPRKKAGKASKHLSPAKKSAAKARAKKAGRRYPNLVDNMRAAAKKKSAKKGTGKKRATKKKATSKKSGRKTTGKKTGRKSAKKRSAAASASQARRSSKAPEKNPRGGLTAAGRRAFAKRDGSHLKPGVMKKAGEMSADDMRRKGSWAVRFYGRAKLPPLVDAKGRPTRHALSAHAWGEPVPKTEAAARRIAAKGERLLARYHKLQSAH